MYLVMVKYVFFGDYVDVPGDKKRNWQCIIRFTWNSGKWQEYKKLLTLRKSVLGVCPFLQCH